MKKILLILTLIASTMSYAQEDNKSVGNGQNELKLNTTNLTIFKFLDVSYERLLNEESSIGISGLINLDNNDDDNTIELDYYRKASLTGYYRRFFGKRYAQGFFTEGFAMLHSRERNRSTGNGKETHTRFALGLSAGVKFKTKKGFTADVYLGIGRNLTNSDNDEGFVGRGGLALGFRF